MMQEIRLKKKINLYIKIIMIRIYKEKEVSASYVSKNVFQKIES